MSQRNAMVTLLHTRNFDSTTRQRDTSSSTSKLLLRGDIHRAPSEASRGCTAAHTATHTAALPATHRAAHPAAHRAPPVALQLVHRLDA